MVWTPFQVMGGVYGIVLPTTSLDVDLPWSAFRRTGGQFEFRRDRSFANDLGCDPKSCLGGRAGEWLDPQDRNRMKRGTWILKNLVPVKAVNKSGFVFFCSVLNSSGVFVGLSMHQQSVVKVQGRCLMILLDLDRGTNWSCLGIFGVKLVVVSWGFALKSMHWDAASGNWTEPLNCSHFAATCSWSSTWRWGSKPIITINLYHTWL